MPIIYAIQIAEMNYNVELEFEGDGLFIVDKPALLTTALTDIARSPNTVKDFDNV